MPYNHLVETKGSVLQYLKALGYYQVKGLPNQVQGMLVLLPPKWKGWVPLG